MKKRIAIILIHLILPAFGYNVFGQLPDNTVFKIIVKETASSEDISCTSTLTRTYAPCTQWTAYGTGGSTPPEFISKAGGLGGLRPKMSIPFYAKHYSGNAKCNDGSTASVVSAGDGLAVWKERNGDAECTRDNSVPDENPTTVESARFERTQNGARITFDAGGLGAGCASYIGFLSIHGIDVDGELIRRFCTFELTNEELNNLLLIQKTNTQTFRSDLGTLNAIAMLSVEVEKEEIQLALTGCSKLGIEEQGEVTAETDAEGGTYQYWAEPAEIFRIESNGGAATLHGATPGRGTLYVEYTSPDGETAKASKEAACVKVESYNGGQAIPQIAFYDVDGNKKPGIITIPVTAQPNDAAELVTFEPVNPGVLTAVGVGNEVILQGITLGKTMVQAKTNCGATTGPAMEVEVVNCDDETVARLEKMKKAAIENLVAAAKDLQGIAGAEEFRKARDELVSSYIDLLAKVGLTIFTSGKTTGVVTKVVDKKEIISTAIPLAAEIADKGSALSEIIGSGSIEELAGNIAKPTSSEAFERAVKLKFGDAAKELYGKSLSAITGLVEVGQAANKFYNNVSQLYHYEELIGKFQEIFEKAERELKFVQSRQQLCGKQTEKPKEQEKPKADQTPQPKEPMPQTKPNPKTDEPLAQQPQTNESTPSEPSTDDEIMVDPERPVIPTRRVGLPYEPDDCGCDKSKALTVSAADFSVLSTGVQNLSSCVDQFSNTSLADYGQALQELSALTDSLSTTLQTDPAAFPVKAKESKPRLDSIVDRIKSYDTAGISFLDKMQKCPESLTEGMEIFQSVEKITVDSIKTNY